MDKLSQFLRSFYTSTLIIVIIAFCVAFRVESQNFGERTDVLINQGTVDFAEVLDKQNEIYVYDVVFNLPDGWTAFPSDPEDGDINTTIPLESVTVAFVKDAKAYEIIPECPESRRSAEVGYSSYIYYSFGPTIRGFIPTSTRNFRDHSLPVRDFLDPIPAEPIQV